MITVLDSADLVEAVTTGITPVPKGVAEDNAAQAAKKEARNGKDGGIDHQRSTQVVEDNKPKPDEKAAETSVKGAESANQGVDSDDDIEGEDGLTPRQKRDYTKAMLSTIGKKHRAQKEAEEFATAQYNERQLAEQRAEDLERELNDLRAKAKPAPVEAKAPDRKDFESDAAYADALIDYRVDQKLKVQAQEQAKREQERLQNELVAQAKARIERAIEIVPDFKELTESVDMEVPKAVAGYMQKSPLFAELGYHLAKNPEILEHLQTLAPDEQLVEIGEIKSKLQPFASKAKVENGEEPSTNGIKPSTETGSAPSKPRITAPVIKPLSSGSAAQVEKDEAEMKTPQVIRQWAKKHNAHLTLRKRH
jgi:hypothetical protein